MPPKKKEQKKDEGSDKNADTSEDGSTTTSTEQKMLDSLALSFNKKSNKMEDPNKPHAFWDGQPVPKLSTYLLLYGSVNLNLPFTIV